MLELVFNQVLGLKVYFEKHLRTAASIKILLIPRKMSMMEFPNYFIMDTLKILDDFKNKQQKCMK